MEALPIVLHLTSQLAVLQINNLQHYCNSELGKTDTACHRRENHNRAVTREPTLYLFCHVTVTQI
jgi:hypothetical protein